MRINKGLLIYVRMLIVGLVGLFGVLTIIASVENPPKKDYVWVKPNGTGQDYNRDNYACMQESQQRVSEYSREGRSAASSSTVQTNETLYNACMNARGWSLQEYKSEEDKAAEKAAAKKAMEAAKKAKKQAREIRRDGSFIAYDNGTVLDTSTNLMWAAKDNGIDIDWGDAKGYCENYRGGGYIDWRMPTQAELATLNDANQSRPTPCNPKYSIHIATKLIDITCFRVYASKQLPIGAENFNFYASKGEGNFVASTHRALPVRDE
ncbi:MAG: DUF1566 domain-containing protein [Deltaproteobacteria bacterium]|nr:DUF1566 domain-containing protein [Deltaproteobacteria bacterium]